MAWRDREGPLNFVFLGDGRVEDDKERDEGNHHENQGVERISCARQFTIPDTAGTSTDLACIITDRRSSQPNLPSHTPDFSNVLISSTLFTSSSPMSLFLVNNSTIITEHNVKSSLAISPCRDHELTPSPAYSEYNIHPLLCVFPPFS